MSFAESDLKVGDRVVYPNQGVCRVVGTTEMEIGGRRETFVKLSREDDQAIVMVPQGRLAKVGLRRVADASDVKKVFEYLVAPVEGPELDWKVRHRTHGEMMSEGGLLGLARVVKGLTTLSDLRPLPPKERELYDNARHLLVSEIAASAGLSEVTAEDAVDVALFPPGVERQKPSLAAALAEAGEDLGLEEEDLGAALPDLGELGGPELEGAEEGEEGGEEEAGEVGEEGGEEVGGGAEAEEAVAEGEPEEAAPAAKPKKAAKAPAKKAAPKAAKKPKAEAKPKAAKAPKAEKAEKAEKPAKKAKAAKAAPKAEKAAKPAKKAAPKSKAKK